MRQAGILAAAALHALDHHVTRLSIDHERARILGEELVALGALVDLERVHTNIVYYGLPADHPMTEKRSDGEMAMVAALREAGVLVTGRGSVMRAVMHLGVDDEAFERTLTIYKRLLA